MNDEELDAYLERVAGKVSNGQQEWTSTREFLERFGAQRRSSRKVPEIRSRLDRHQLATEPDFELAGYDQQISFRCIDKPLYVRRLDEIQKQIAEEERPVAQVRNILRWFGYERRSAMLVNTVAAALSDRGLETAPDFRDAHIDSEVVFQKVAPKPEPPLEAPSSNVDEQHVAGDDTDSSEPASEPATEEDATFRIGTLESASAAQREELVWIKPGAPVSEAVTLMLQRDISHLPVMASPSRVLGVVTWKEITKHLTLRRGSVSDAVELVTTQATEKFASEPFFRALPTVIESNAVLIRDKPGGMVQGIVTKADVSRKFSELTEPFLLLSEIEHYVRRIVDRAGFSAAELKDLVSSESEREVTSLQDLALGEFVRILQNPTTWDRLRLPEVIDRTQFARELDGVRKVRNEVMHFAPDSPTARELRTLRQFARFLQELSGMA